MNSKASSQKSFFGFGFLVFLIGLIGAAFLWQQERAVAFDEFFADSAYGFVEIDLNKKSVQKVKTLFPETDWQSFFPEYVQQGILEGDVGALTTWLGNRASVGFFPNGEVIVGTKFRSAGKLESFLDRFTLEGESFVKEHYGPFKIWTPEFSSPLAIGFSRKRVFLPLRRIY